MPKGTPMITEDLRKTVEGVLGTLTPAKAQQLAKDMLEPSAAKEQVAKTAADLLEWSHTNRERMSGFVRARDLRPAEDGRGVATQAELDALKKRVRDLERAAGTTASGRRQALASRSPAQACGGEEDHRVVQDARAKSGGQGLVADLRRVTRVRPR